MPSNTTTWTRRMIARVRACRRRLKTPPTVASTRRLSAFNAYLRALAMITSVMQIAGYAQTIIPSKATISDDKPAVNRTITETTPAIAPGYEAPKKPLPPLARVGVDATDALPLTLDDVIRLALQNNNDIDTSRINVEIAEQDLKTAHGAYDPIVSNETFFERRSTPYASFLTGANGSLTETETTSKMSLGGASPWAGGSYKFEFGTSRISSNNVYNAINPSNTAQFSLSYTQPLWRGRKIDDNRRQIQIANKNLSLTDVQFRQRAIDVISRVEEAYWQLVYALRNLQVQNDAVKQAKAQVETNQRQVKQGVLAPIDVVEAEAQVKNFEQAVYAAQEDVTKAENGLKTLMLPNRSAELWSRALLPVTPVTLEAPRVPLPEALSTAFANRLELAELKTGSEINKINTTFYRDQTKPQVDLTMSYSSNGLAGTENEDNPLLGSLQAMERRLAELSDRAGLPRLETPTLQSLPADMQGGYGQSLANMLGQNNPTVKVGVKISLPLKNRTAEGRLGHSLAEGRRIDTLKAQTEQAIEADVRNSMQAVRSVEARLAAAAAARESAEQQFTSEQRKFEAGMSTVFLVLQRQTDLIAARGRELQTQTDLNKAIANFQRAMGSTFQYRGVAVRSDKRTFEQSKPVPTASVNGSLWSEPVAATRPTGSSRER
jgi:outer membrane protein TolC